MAKQLKEQTEGKSAQTTLSILKAIGITALVAVTVIIIVAVVVNIKAGKRVEAKYQELIASRDAEIVRLNEELENQIRIIDREKKELITVDVKALESETQNIGELATQEYLYTNASRFTDTKMLGKTNFKLPWTEKSFIAKWNGTIKAGFDVGQIKLEAAETEEERTLTVYLPAMRILSHEIDANSIETLDKSNGLFNRITVEDVRNFDKTSKEEMEKRALDSGLLEKAAENAATVMEGLLRSNPGVTEGQYKIVVVPAG